jgi:hypothetical protein
MGCFASTCAVSGLPLEAGDRVLWLPLVENPYAHTMPCNMSDLYYVRSWPILGRYDDYGQIDDFDVESIANWTFLEGLKKDAVVAPSPASLEAALESIWRGGLTVKRGSFDIETAFAGLVDELAARDPSLQTLLKPPTAEGVKDVLTVHQAMIRLDVWEALVGLSAPEEWPGYDVRKEVERWWSSNAIPIRELVPYTLGPMTHLRLAWKQHGVKPWPDPELAAFLRRTAELLHVTTILGNTRYWWRPTYPVGPQGGEWALHHQVLGAFADIARVEGERRAAAIAELEAGFAALGDGDPTGGAGDAGEVP